MYGKAAYLPRGQKNILLAKCPYNFFGSLEIGGRKEIDQFYSLERVFGLTKAVKEGMN